jgi:hypothetical protein
LLLFGEAMSDSTGVKQSNIGRAVFLAVLGEVEFDKTFVSADPLHPKSSRF